MLKFNNFGYIIADIQTNKKVFAYVQISTILEKKTLNLGLATS